MPKFTVCVVESRDLFFEIEAEDASEAEAIAMDMDVTESVRDQFRERTLDWCEESP